MTLQSTKTVGRIWNHFKDPDKIIEMRKEFDDALSLFQVRHPAVLRSVTLILCHGFEQLGSLITAGLNVPETLKATDIDAIVERIKDKLGERLG